MSDYDPTTDGVRFETFGEVPPIDPIPRSSEYRDYFLQLHQRNWLELHERKNREPNPTLRDGLSDVMRLAEAAADWMRKL